MAEIRNNHLGWDWNPINNGKNYLPTGEFTGFLKHQQYLGIFTEKLELKLAKVVEVDSKDKEEMCSRARAMPKRRFDFKDVGGRCWWKCMAQNDEYIYIYTWNPNDPCFGWKRPCFGGLTFKNRGHLGSRYMNIWSRAIFKVKCEVNFKHLFKSYLGNNFHSYVSNRLKPPCRYRVKHCRMLHPKFPDASDQSLQSIFLGRSPILRHLHRGGQQDRHLRSPEAEQILVKPKNPSILSHLILYHLILSLLYLYLEPSWLINILDTIKYLKLLNFSTTNSGKIYHHGSFDISMVVYGSPKRW